jgi:hypothetical protein
MSDEPSRAWNSAVIDNVLVSDLALRELEALSARFAVLADLDEVEVCAVDVDELRDHPRIVGGVAIPYAAAVARHRNAALETRELAPDLHEIEVDRVQ